MSDKVNSSTIAKFKHAAAVYHNKKWMQQKKMFYIEKILDVLRNYERRSLYDGKS